MNALKIIQGLLIALAALVFLCGFFTVFQVFPRGALILTPGGLQRMTDTLLLFSIAIGAYLIVTRKK